jgi:hypothetical protein
VSAGSHYCDVTGEPEFIERMILSHDEEARRKSLHIVHACGFDSIPSDLGVLHCMAEAQRRWGYTPVLSRVDSFFTLHGKEHGVAGSYGTWSSLVHGISHRGALAGIRRQLKAKYAKEGGNSIERIGPTPKVRLFHFEPRVHLPVALFPGADSAIVRNSQAQLRVRGYRGVLPYYTVSFTVPTWFHLLLLLLYGLLLLVLASFSWTRRLLLDHPRLFSAGRFSKEGPTQAQLDETSLTFDFFAEGFKKGPPSTTSPSLPPADLHLHLRVNMGEPGYVATPILVTHAALTLLKDVNADTHVVPRGVLTPGAAFRETDLVGSLHRAGITFKFIEDV